MSQVEDIPQARSLIAQMIDTIGNVHGQLQSVKQFTESAAGQVAELLSSDHESVGQFRQAGDQCDTASGASAAYVVELEALDDILASI
jgi:hypothetical protein